ncbi:f-actin-capping protein subunit alpha [Bipolaris maydis]|nr:f-actin-capping protein subunit alpha [Bipolaris maydis]
MVIDKNIDDAQSHLPQVSSGFTAINHGPVHREQLLTPESSAATSVRPNPASSRAISSPRRQHNPNVARYLGLGSTIEPDHLKHYAPRPAKPDGRLVKSERKRVRRADDKIIQRSSRTREPPGRPAASTPAPTLYSTQSSQDTYDSNDSRSIIDNHTLPQSYFAQPEVSHVTPMSTLDSETVRMNSQDAAKALHAGNSCLSLPDRGEDDIIGIYPDTDVSNVLCRNNDGITTTSDDYEFDMTDDELLILASGFDGTCFDIPHNISDSPAKSYPTDNEQRHAGDNCNENAPEEAPAINTSQHTRKKFVSPVTLTTRLLAVTGDGGSANARTPIVRSPFPKPARDRSPIIGLSSNIVVTTPPKTQSPKARSLSDSTPRLEPSPKIHESARMSKDDHTIDASPSTPRRPDFLSRGLSLQMPPRESHMPSPAHFAARVPLSPQLDARNTYASPGSVLPRRSRGAEFSRACTNLHHSTLPDQSSPDSSPTITQKGIKIPPRKPRSNSMLMESPNVSMHGSGWSHGDRTAPSSSVGSINMMGSEDSSSSSDEVDPLDPDDHDDPMITTPQAKTNVLFPGLGSGNNGIWANLFSPGAQPNFASMHRARLRKGRSRKSSSSASGHSSMASPGPGSPPNGKEGGYFAREAAIRKAGSRRESLSLFANDLHISSGNDSGDEAVNLPQTPGVVRRAVTRRGNLLPKSRQFGRIRAELFEEAAPVDSEFRREAEIIRQVRESDVDQERTSVTAQSSPSLLPAVPGLDGPLEGVPEEGDESSMSLDNANTKGLFGVFGSLHSAGRNSTSNGFWNQRAAHTPPPSCPRAESSAMSEDMNMDSPIIGPNGGASRASTPGPMQPPTAAEALKKSNKRRRDDDFDEASIKRRAVSPGVSVHNSPVISQSPAQRDGNLWGTSAKASRETSISGHSYGERSNSGGSMSMTPTLGPKRIGLQGMTDTSDAIQLADVTKAIKSILGDDSVQNELSPAFQKYNEEQFATTKLPGGSTEVLVSQYNSLGDGRYYDIDTQSSFDFDHVTGKASAVQSYVVETSNDDLLKSLNKALSTHAAEHYPKSSHGVYPIPSSSNFAIITVANKYSPTNYWNGRWRSSYIYDSSSGSITGSIKVDVHYYEDGNVRLLTTKEVSVNGSGASGPEVVRKIAAEEKKYQEDLNKAFASLSEGAFKSLRRQLPITRQKIEWEKISGYRLGQDIGGGRR